MSVRLIKDPLLGHNFIELSNNIELKVNRPTFKKNILTPEKPYEGKYSTYFNFYQSDKEILGFYKCIPNFNTSLQLTGILKSSDGLNFERPKLNIINKFGKDSNLILSGHISHAFFGFYDPLKLINGSPFKAFIRNVVNGNDCMELWLSKNNIHWSKHKTIISSENNPFRCFRGKVGFDTLNNIFYDPYRKRFQCYLRHNPVAGQRKIQTGYSKDLINWNDFQLIDLPNYNIYVPNIQMYPDSPFFIGFPTYQNMNDHHSKYVSIIFSRDSIKWYNIIENENLFPELKKPIVGCSGITSFNDEFYIYLDHFYRCKVDAFSIPKHRLTYYQNIVKDKIGTFQTKPIKIINLNNIYLNYFTEENGYIIVKMLNPQSNKYIRESVILTGDFSDKKIEWIEKDIKKEENEYTLEFTVFNAKVFGVSYFLIYP